MTCSRGGVGSAEQDYSSWLTSTYTSARLNKRSTTPSPPTTLTPAFFLRALYTLLSIHKTHNHFHESPKQIELSANVTAKRSEYFIFFFHFNRIKQTKRLKRFWKTQIINGCTIFRGTFPINITEYRRTLFIR